MRAAAADGSVACIESTSNQVNQDGGYTGMTPAAFRDAALAAADDEGLPRGRLILGGDHLGPYPWRSLPAGQAMANAAGLVTACVLAGYTKIHLDCSMRCAGDPGGEGEPLPEELVTGRAAELCRAAEAACAGLPPGSDRPVYVIGTEVPRPGGEVAGDSGPRVTRPADVERTLAATRAAFDDAGLDEAWRRVIAVVVQPGIEFGDDTVVDYVPGAAAGLAAVLGRRPLVFEAHSTDYQRPAALRSLVEDRFAILKVGPWLTFALREAVFALQAIEQELLPSDRWSHVRETLERAMLERPADWAPYYGGEPGDQALARAFSFSDRCRYYWQEPAVKEALDGLLRDLVQRPIPLTLLSQYLPEQYAAVREGDLRPEPLELVRHRVSAVLDAYAQACRPGLA